MASFDKPVKIERCVPRTFSQIQACEHVERVFGRGPTSVRYLSPHGTPSEVCVLTWAVGIEERVEFICVGGLLVGIPPKRRG